MNTSNTTITPERKKFEDLTLIDDYMFYAVMREETNLIPLLETILEIKIQRIFFVEPQKYMKEGYDSHGIQLDLYVQDTNNQVFNVEVQTTNKPQLPKRMRYYQSVIDVDMLSRGADYKLLKKSFVIFICNYDPFGQGQYIYRFENLCTDEIVLPLKDDAFKIVINTKGRSGKVNDNLKHLLDYLEKGIVSDKYTKQLNEAVRQIKASEERRHEYMITRIRDMELREEGKILGAISIMQDFGLDDDTIIEKLMQKFQLTREEAERYLLPVSV